GRLDATASSVNGGVYLSLGSAAVVTRIDAGTRADVVVSAQGSLTAPGAGTRVTGRNITLTSVQGSVGSTTLLLGIRPVRTGVRTRALQRRPFVPLDEPRLRVRVAPGVRGVRPGLPLQRDDVAVGRPDAELALDGQRAALHDRRERARVGDAGRQHAAERLRPQ